MWKIRFKNPYFLLGVVPPSLCAMGIAISEFLFWLIFDSNFDRGYYHAKYYKDAVYMSLSNSMYMLIAPIIIIFTIVFAFKRRVTFGETVISISYNIFIALFAIAVVMNHGGV